MGNHKLEQHQSRVNTTSPIVSEVAIVETRKQPAEVRVIQSLNAGIITTLMEMVVAPNIDVIRRGILIRSTTKLGNESGGVLARRNLN